MLRTLNLKIWGDLRANARQFFAVWLIVILGTMFYGGTYAAGINIETAFHRAYDQLQYFDFQTQFDPAPPEIVSQVQAIPGVKQAEGRLVLDGRMHRPGGSGHLATLRLISVPDDHPAAISRSVVMAGHELQGPHELLLLQRFADRHNIRPGDAIQVTVGGETYPMVVAGLVFNPEYLVAGRSARECLPNPSSFGVAWLRYSELTEMTNHEGEINEVVLTLADGPADGDPARQAQMRQALARSLHEQANVSIFSRVQTASGGVIDTHARGILPILAFFSAAFLFGATVVTAILLGRLVESERQRIGTLRAMGVTRQELMRHYLTFGLLIGATGGIVGSILGFFTSYGVIYTYIQTVLGGELPGFVNVPQIPVILFGYVVVVVASTCAGAYPAWVQSATPPGVALRPATPRTPNAMSRLSLSFLPLTLRMPLRNLLRVPGRSLGVAVGVATGATMIFSAALIWDTVMLSLVHSSKINQFDLRVEMNQPQLAETLRAQAAALPGVAAVQVGFAAPIEVVNDNGTELDTVVIALEREQPFAELTTLAGIPALSRPEGVWIGANLARILGLDLKHPEQFPAITLRAGQLSRSVQVLGVVSQTMGNSVFTTFEQLTAVTPSNLMPATMALIRAEPGKLMTVREALVDFPGMRSVIVTEEELADINAYLDFFRIAILICGGFGLILTGVVLFNAVNVSLTERKDELAVMRALGTNQGELILGVTLEQLSVAAFGAVPGVGIGLEVGELLSHTWDTNVLGMVTTFELSSLVIGLVTITGIVLVSEIPGLWAVQKVDLGRVSKSQSI